MEQPRRVGPRRVLSHIAMVLAVMASVMVATASEAGAAVPVLTRPLAQTSTQGTAITPLTIAATDPDAGQTLTFSQVGLPAGLSLNASTGVITGTPTTVQTSVVTVKVTDNGAPTSSTSASFTWTVNASGVSSSLYRAVNLNGPAVAAAGLNFEASTAPNFSGGPYAFCNQNVTLIPATDAGTATMVRCSNFAWSGATQATMTAIPTGTYQVSLYNWEDNNSETFNVLINGATVATNVVSGPTGTWKALGPYPVNITNGTLGVTTSGGTANLSGLVVTRTGGAAPVNQTPIITNPGNRTNTQGVAITPLTIAASDPDAGQTLSFSQTGLPAGLTINATTGVITGTPTTVSSATVAITVTDNGSPTKAATTSFTWGITASAPVNQTPIITNPGNRTNTQSVAIAALTITASDPDAGQTLTFSQTGLPAGLTINAATGVITGTPTTPAINTVAITVTDNGSPTKSATASFTWTITAAAPVNQTPIITNPGNRTNTQSVAIAPLTITASDPDAGQTLTFSQTGLPAGLTLNAATGVITGTPTTVGSSTVAVTVTDNGSPTKSAATTFTWTISATGGTSTVYRAVNLNGPAVTGSGINFEAGTAPNFSSGPNAFCNQNVTLSPATDTGTGTMLRCSNFAWSGATQATMTAIPTGTYQVSIYTWEDNFSETFNVLVNGVTVATNVVSGAAGSWKVLGPYTVAITNGTLAVTTSGGTANLSGLVVTTTTGGPPVNQTPIVTSPGNRTSTQGLAIAPLTITASDPDVGQTLTFSQTGLPAGLTINATTGVITGTPTTVGTSTVTVTVTDNGSPTKSAATTFTWTINSAGNSTLYRAINLNGPAVTGSGINFEAGTAPNFSSGPQAFCDTSVPLIPATDAGTAAMLRCSNFAWTGGTQATMTAIPTGTYQVSLYTWEDNFSETFSVVMNGIIVASNVVSGPAGSWKVLGPYPVDITNGTLAITTTGGTANLSGLVLQNLALAPTSVAITAPANGASVSRPTTITGTATDTTGAGIDHVHLQIVDGATGAFWNGTSFQPGATEVLPTVATPGGATTTWSYEFDPPTISAQPYQLTATAHGRGGLESSPFTRSFSFTTGGGGGGTFDPTKVVDEFVAGGNWNQAVSADFLPNGHILVLTLPGVVYDVNPATGVQSQLLDITAKVWQQGEAGALDLMVDQAGTGFYVYFTVENSDRLRISHFTIGSSVEQVIWTNPGVGNPSSNSAHLGGAMNIGPDGKLYIGIGDRFSGLSNDLTNVFGKILRINTDGTVPTDNPFYDGAGPNIDEIWATGFRNPYRGNFDKATGIYWQGDVGGNIDAQAYEEVNIVQRGARYGWPECEGPLGPPKNGPTCPAGVTGPVFSYPHDPGASQYFNRAIVGGEVYHGSTFPLEGYYLYADYPTNSFYWLQLGADGRTAVANGSLYVTATPTPVWMGVGPDGAIYWVSIGSNGNGQLRRLNYTGVVNRPPTITTASATPTTGAAPLTVAFTGAATDPDGTPVTYAWDFGDGTSSTQASPSHTYSAGGSYQVRLRVTSGGTTVSSDLITIKVGTPPIATITSPASGTIFNAGATITINGTGSDPDTGPLPASALSWDIKFLHNDHFHPAATGTGSSITFPIPTTGHDYAGNTRYQVTLTVTDPDGLTTSTSIILQPNKTNVSVTSNQATTMTVDGITQNLPHTIDTLVGFQHVVAVPASQCVAGQLWTFSSWSDGGALSHTITVTAGLVLSSTYVNSGTAC